MKGRIWFVLISGMMFLSCASKKNIIYFQPDESSLNATFESNAPKLQPGDILAISVTADDVRATQPFNQVSTYQGSGGTFQNNNPFIPTYVVDNQGKISFPMLGEIEVGGLTRAQAMNNLRKEVSKYIVNPGISLEIRNFRITVLGEVKNPGTFPITNDRITILEALGMAGDLTINGVRKNVLVIREQNGVKTEHRVDLTQQDALNSPVYYLAQNDVIYVQPNGARVQSSKYTQNTSVFISVAGVIISVISILTRK